MRRAFIALGLILALARPATGFEIEEERFFPGGARELRILSTTDTAVFAPLIVAFQSENPGISVRYTVASTRELYQAVGVEGVAYDLAVSSAMDLQMKLVNDGFAASFSSDTTALLPPWAHWRDQLYAFSQEPVVLVVSRSGLSGLTPPETRDELVRLIRENPQAMRGRIGTYDPMRSGAGYLFATQDARQSNTFWRLSEVMGSVGPVLYTSTSAMIGDLKTGRLVMAYNVLGPYVAAHLPDWPDGQVIEFRDYTNVLLRTAFIPADAADPGLGSRFLDFLLSERGQEVLETRSRLPRIDGAALAAEPHLYPIRLDPGLLVYVDPLKRSKFLSEWTAAVVQP
jgi:iron(III) transport system substrate-binding protein